MLYANTDDGSSALWVLDGDGIVIDNISYSIADRAPILAQINEHYGTSFTGWSDNEIGLRIGDTLPNWDAYEKIEIPSRKIALNISQDAPMFIFGGIKNDIYILSVDEEESSWLADEEGNILYDRGPSLDDKEFIIGLFSEQGISLTDIITSVKQYEAGQIVPNWSNYEKIGG